MTTRYHVVDAFDGHRGESIESTHRSHEAADAEAERMNRGLSGRKYRVMVKGDDCPACKGSGTVYRGGLNRACGDCGGSGAASV